MELIQEVRSVEVLSFHIMTAKSHGSGLKVIFRAMFDMIFRAMFDMIFRAMFDMIILQYTILTSKSI